MNIFGEEYNKYRCIGNSERKLREFGLNQIENVFSYLGYSVSTQHSIYLSGLWSLNVVEKNELLIKQGDFNQSIFFIISGTLRFHVDIENSDKTVMILDDGNFALAKNAFVRGEGSIISISACQRTYLLEMRIEDYRRYCQSQFGDILGSVLAIMLGRYEIYQHNLYLLLRRSCIEKINGLYALHPSLFLNTSNIFLAALLNIKSETLSRTKQKLGVNKKIYFEKRLGYSRKPRLNKSSTNIY